MISPDLVGMCPKFREFKNELYCITGSAGVLGVYIYRLSLTVFLSLLPLLFLNPKIYRTWRWFAAVVLPIMILIIADTEEYAFINREIMSIKLSELFVFITFLIIIYKSIRLKFSKKQKDSK